MAVGNSRHVARGRHKSPPFQLPVRTNRGHGGQVRLRSHASSPLLLSVAVVAVVAPYPVTLPEVWTTHLWKQVELSTLSYINYINRHLKLNLLT